MMDDTDAFLPSSPLHAGPDGASSPVRPALPSSGPMPAPSPFGTAPVSSDPNYHFVSATPAHARPISALKFSHDGRFLASAGADAALRLYRVVDGEVLTQISAPAASTAAAAAATAAGSPIPASAAPSSSAPLSRLSPRLELHSDLPAAHALGINDVAFTHDGHYLLTASDDKTLIVWDIDCQPARPLRTCVGHTSYVFCVALSKAGNLAVSGSYDESLRVWDVKHAKCLRVIKAHSEPISAVDFNRDGSLIVSSSYDGLCRVWETSSGRCLKTIYNEKTPPVSFVRFSPNGKFILAASLDNTLRLWDFSQKDYCVKTYTSSSAYANSRFCLPSSFCTAHAPKQHIVSGTETGRIVLWEVVSTEVVATLVPPANSGVGLEATGNASTTAAPGAGAKGVGPIMGLTVHPHLAIIAAAGMEPPYAIMLWAHAQ